MAIDGGKMEFASLRRIQWRQKSTFT